MRVYRLTCPVLIIGLVSVVLCGCLGSGSGSGPAEGANKKGLFSKASAWLKEDSDAPKKGESTPAPTPALTQKLPVGSVHLVQEDARFVLIRSSRLTVIAPDAELITYDSGGRPTGRLKLSPERKSGFLAADIIEGRPQTGDRVLLYGVAAGAEPTGAGDPATGTVEVLE